MIGRVLDHYRLLERLGDGGMGEVYGGRDERLQRPVAVKLVREDLASDETARARLLREARLASSLNHPNICIIHQVGEADGQPYIVMERVEGEPLSRRVAAGALPAEEVVVYGSQIADALAYAHERGVVHRDLKSANLILTPDGRIKVLDFGLARQLLPGSADGASQDGTRSLLTRHGTVVGTLHYMAPEVLRGQPADVRADIWALGIVLFEMITGERPFRGQTEFEVSSAILNHPVPALPADVPPVLDAIVQRCLARNPGQRWQRAGEVRAALEVAAQADRASGVKIRTIELRAADRPDMVPKGRFRQSSEPEATEYFARAMMFMQEQLQLSRARRMLERALEIDPRFSEARAMCALTHALELETGRSNDPTALYQAEAELRRLLVDDPECASARGVLGAVCLLLGRKETARLELENALRLESGSMPGRMWTLVLHRSNGNYAEAEEIARAVLAANPTFWPARAALGEMLRERGELEAAVREQEKVLEQDAANAPAVRYLARVHIDADDVTRARATLDGSPREAVDNFHIRLAWALLLAREGRSEEARAAGAPAVDRFAEVHVLSAVEMASFHALLGEKQTAIEWLERAVRRGDERLTYFRRNPLLQPLHGYSGFSEILTCLEARGRG